MGAWRSPWEGRELVHELTFELTHLNSILCRNCHVSIIECYENELTSVPLTSSHLMSSVVIETKSARLAVRSWCPSVPSDRTRISTSWYQSCTHTGIWTWKCKWGRLEGEGEGCVQLLLHNLFTQVISDIVLCWYLEQIICCIPICSLCVGCTVCKVLHILLLFEGGADVNSVEMFHCLFER